jgi:sugar lactone lactonase YvrE
LKTLDLLAGQPGGPGWVDGPLANAHFSDPWTMTSDGNGHTYVADGDVLRVIDVAAGTVTTLSGVFRQVGCTDGPVAQATFNTPSGLAFAAGQLYLTDTENHTIRKIDVKGGTVSTIAGTCRQPGAVDAAGTAARFQEPEGLALDASGNLYIGDTDNNTIRVMNVATSAVTTLAGAPGMAGTTDGVGAAALFSKPKALAFDGAGTLYAIDALNQSLRKIDVATQTVSTLATFKTSPQGLAVDGPDIIASLGDDTIVRVAPDGTVTVLAGTSGAQGYVDGAGSVARFNSPAGLLDDGSGTVLLADEGNAVLRSIVLAGPTVGTYGGAKSSGSSDGAKTQARFFKPAGLVADADHVYVADTNNDTIRAIAMSTGATTTIAGTAGQSGMADGVGDSARFDQPEGLALDGAAMQLYVADASNAAVRRVDLSTGAVSTLAFTIAPGDPFSGLGSPSGLVLEDGHLYLTDYMNETVEAIDLKKGEISTLAGTYGLPGSVDGVGTKAAFYGPIGIAADGRGNLFVADDLNDTVRKIEIASRMVTTLAGQAATQGSSDGIGADAHFYYPTGVAADGAGDVFVSDLVNNTVRRVDASTGAVKTVIGSLSASGVRLGPLPAQLTQPSAIALTPSGALLVVSESSVLIAH